MAATVRKLMLSVVIYSALVIFALMFVEHGKEGGFYRSQRRYHSLLRRSAEDDVIENISRDSDDPIKAQGYNSIEENSLEACPEISPLLIGKLDVNANFIPSEKHAIDAAGYDVTSGCYEPKTCTANQTVAIIVPYKNREQHLVTLMNHLHPILQRQLIRYCVFVTEQYDDGAFNKARVMNAGFLEIMNSSKWKLDCLIFHDVDMLLEDDRNIYRCAPTPKHLSPALDKFKYKINYGTHFGGVGAISVDQYKLVNGHSNRFYGWGGEDTDIENRFTKHNLTTVWNETVGRYKMIPHHHPWYFNPISGLGSYKKKRTDAKRFDDKNILPPQSDPSGISSIKYSVKKVQQHRLYTKMSLDIRTFLVNRASVRFQGHSDTIYIENPWFTNQRLQESSDRLIRGFGMEALGDFQNYQCDYRYFKSKTVNMTLGVKVKGNYNTIYTDLEEAKANCNKLAHYCGSILETSPGFYQLRSTGFMHETTLQYKLGRYPAIQFTEKHSETSVFAKICWYDTRYLQFLTSPVLLDLDTGASTPRTHQIDLELQMYRTENVSLNYTVKIYSAHKAIMEEMETITGRSSGVYDSLSITYSDSVFILNMTDPDSVRPFLPEGVDSIDGISLQETPVLRVRTPPVAVPRLPGCYICESAITDQNGTPLLKWNWWFESQGRTQKIDSELRKLHWTSSVVGSTEFTEAESRRKFREQTKFLNKKTLYGLSDTILGMVAKSYQIDDVEALKMIPKQFQR